ncbi:hypothetical protein BDN72DRAFT_897310 [Pluteus cervinus]|uniref:Uncharacterized protein n=1 Tax=Pluteus cervinus TaxID=181527 RepID=A0ACD3AWR1_9AGAR|nr:hypothetical protein BDN72DRAFT_897310 [Pluteus cervinus]
MPSPRTAERRLNTVYDFAGLRLRPNGYRVSQSEESRPTNYATSTVRDLNDNVFAPNALGVGALRKFRTKRVHEDDICGDEDGENFEAVQEDVGNLASQLPAGRSPPPKRVKLSEDLDDARGAVKTADVFGTPDFDRSLTADESVARDDRYPSSDLLKYIHHFAGGFYHERGELPLTRPKPPTSPAASLAQTDSSGRAARDSSPSMHDTHEDDEEDIEDMSDAHSHSSMTDFGKNLIGMHHEKQYPIDMYRTLDGSALVAVGVLIEESLLPEDDIVDSSFDLEKEESEMLRAVPWSQPGPFDREDLEVVDSDEDPDIYLPSET